MSGLYDVFSSPVGPLTTALDEGITSLAEQEKNALAQKYKQAELDKVLLDVDKARTMNPLDIQAKQQANEAAAMKAKQERAAYQDEILSSAIPKLKSLKGPQRFAEMERIFTQAGLPLDEADRKHMYSQNPDTFLSDLEAKHKWSLEQNREMAKQRLVNQGHLDVAALQAKNRSDIAASKATKTAASIEQQASAGKLSYEKAAVAFSVMAMNEDDPVKQKQYQDKAAQYEQLAAKLKAAGNAGKVDVGAATNLPTTSYEPVLVPGATPPANPNSPKLPQGWSIK